MNILTAAEITQGDVQKRCDNVRGTFVSEARRLSHVESHLAGGAGQSHPSLQLRQDLLLQAVQLVSSGSASFGHSVQLVAASVHQVVVDGEQRLVMDLRNHMSTLMLSSLDNEGCSQRNRRCVPASCCTDGPASSGCC